jgi:hypothetical protein
MSSRLNGWDRAELNQLTERVARLEELVGKLDERAVKPTNLQPKPPRP